MGSQIGGFRSSLNSKMIIEAYLVMCASITATALSASCFSIEPTISHTSPDNRLLNLINDTLVVIVFVDRCRIARFACRH